MRKTTVAAFALALVALGGCDNKESTGGVGLTKALPFSIESVMLSDMFKDNLKVARVNVGVTGGTPSEWAATSAAIAEKTATFGADSIEVTVRRNEITQAHGVMFREVVHAYYSPNPSHTVWDGGKTWEMYVANPNQLATQQDVAIFEEFQALNEKLLEKGVDGEAADKKAGAVIAKKYNLPKDWRLPNGNIDTNVDGFDRKSIAIDAAPAQGSLDTLTRCMDGKIIRMLTTCGS